MLKAIYLQGFGTCLHALLGHAQLFVKIEKGTGNYNWQHWREKFGIGRMEQINRIRSELGIIENHYKKTMPLIRNYRRDPAFQPVFFTNKQIPALVELVERLIQNPSDKNFSELNSLVQKIWNESYKLRITAQKYAILNQIADKMKTVK